VLSRGLLDEVRGLVLDVIGRPAARTAVEPLQIRDDAAVLLVPVASGPRLIVKLASPAAPHPVSFERTRMLTTLAGAAGAPVPEILAADDSMSTRPWRYVIAEHIDGTPWRELRPSLSAEQVAEAHRQLAAALLAVQTVRFSSFGELDLSGRPPDGQDVLAALHQRAELRIRDERLRKSFRQVLDREAGLFAAESAATLCHDDLHHGNVLFRPDRDGLRLVGLLDWDKAWAGPAESDVARMAFWDDMTGPAFWASYRIHHPARKREGRRRLVYQLLWCLEYDDGSARHAADTNRVRQRLAVRRR
jgi:Ser/Thr protein kinase RdoA (MazF antagonist)